MSESEEQVIEEAVERAEIAYEAQRDREAEAHWSGESNIQFDGAHVHERVPSAEHVRQDYIDSIARAVERGEVHIPQSIDIEVVGEQRVPDPESRPMARVVGRRPTVPSDNRSWIIAEPQDPTMEPDPTPTSGNGWSIRTDPVSRPLSSVLEETAQYSDHYSDVVSPEHNPHENALIVDEAIEEGDTSSIQFNNQLLRPSTENSMDLGDGYIRFVDTDTYIQINSSGSLNISSEQIAASSINIANHELRIDTDILPLTGTVEIDGEMIDIPLCYRCTSGCRDRTIEECDLFEQAEVNDYIGFLVAQAGEEIARINNGRLPVPVNMTVQIGGEIREFSNVTVVGQEGNVVTFEVDNQVTHLTSRYDEFIVEPVRQNRMMVDPMPQYSIGTMEPSGFTISSPTISIMDSAEQLIEWLESQEEVVEYPWSFENVIDARSRFIQRNNIVPDRIVFHPDDARRFSDEVIVDALNGPEPMEAPRRLLEMEHTSSRITRVGRLILTTENNMNDAETTINNNILHRLGYGGDDLTITDDRARQRHTITHRNGMSMYITDNYLYEYIDDHDMPYSTLAMIWIYHDHNRVEPGGGPQDSTANSA